LADDVAKRDCQLAGQGIVRHRENDSARPCRLSIRSLVQRVVSKEI